MADNKDFDYGICKIPRVDKNGNDITNDRIGKGGRHRDDGTYSGPVYDVEMVKHDPSQPQIEYRDRYIERRPTFGQMLLLDLADRYVPVLIDRGFDAVSHFCAERWERHKQKKAAERRAKAEAERRAQVKARQTALRQANQTNTTSAVASTSMTDGFDAAYKQYQINMTSEEAQKELFEAYVLHIMSAKKLWKVANANITDGDGSMIQGREMIDKFCNSTLVGTINQVLQSNPALLDGWTGVALKEILGRELVVDACFVPIRSQDLRMKLLDVRAA